MIATMLQEKVQEYFANPLNSNVLIFFDKSGAYQEEVNNWSLSDIHLLTAGKRYFYLKTQLHTALKGKKVFLYFPFGKPTGKDWQSFPMLSAYYANKELLMDEHGQFVEQYKLDKHQLPLVKKYWSILSTKTGIKTLAKVLTAENFTEPMLKRGLVAYYLGMSTVPDVTLCLVKMIVLHQKPSTLRTALKNIVKADLESTVLDWISKYFGKRSIRALSLDSVQELAYRIKYNMILGSVAEPVSEDNYKSKYHIKDTIVQNAFDTFLVDWKNSSYNSQIEAVFQETAADIKEDRLVKWYGVHHTFGYYTDKMSYIVLLQSLEQVETQPEKVFGYLVHWTNQTNLDKYAIHFEAMKNIARTYQLLQQEDNYKYNSLDEYIERYASHWYKVDLHYRQAILNAEDLMAKSSDFEGHFEKVIGNLHLIYDRFLVELNREWLALLAEQSFDYSAIKAPKQYDFYASNIEQMEYKTAVIISDGLRFEAGMSLYEALLSTDDKVTVEMKPTLASIPSYTKLGMANLLPNKGMSAQLNNTGTDLEFTINGTSTEGLKNRLQILRQANPKANVEAYRDVIKMDMDKGRETFKAHPLTYIYHNQIDTIADNVKSENHTFSAVQQTIIDLKKLINKLRNSWNVYYIYIISDHGFLYNHLDLAENSKEEMPKDDEVWGKHSRFLMSHAGYQIDNGYSLLMKQTTNFESDIQVHLPFAINRFKRQGSGKQYVHGGASLQELVIPSIFYYKKRDDSDLEFVSVIIINEKTLKITSNTVKLQFLQNQAVSTNYKKAIWLAGIYTKDGELLSDEQEIVFDKTSENPVERMQNILLKFNTAGSKSTFCYVRIFDWSGKNPKRLNPIFEKRLNNNSLFELDF